MPLTPRSECRPGNWIVRPLLVIIVVSIAAHVASSSPGRSSTAFFVADEARDTLFALPVPWVVLDSVRVIRNQDSLSEFRDWRIVEPGNRIWLFRPLAEAETLRVEYVYEPFPLYRTYSRHTLRELGRETAEVDSTDTLRIASSAAAPTTTTEGWSRLNKSGSLIRSVQVGTDQDLALESALNLQIEGRVGRNVDVIAALTDQSTPIQPEGTTETLNELEKVFVSVRSPNLAATLGDFTLDLPGGLYDSYSRKLTGVMGEANYSTAAAIASAAVSRGEFHTNTFPGQEANQGPYPLTGRNGEVGILVLAGTERVYLDGQLARRGEGNDYVIDYSAGEITFTSRRLITSNTRIVVDFEYANEDYERFYGSGRGQAAFATDKINGAVTWITESDDRNRPLGIALNDSDKVALENAGDDPLLAVAFAADSVGPGGGDYVRRDTTLFDGTTYSIFVFSSRDSNRSTGDWRVVFDEFGIGAGDYEATADTVGLAYFYWVGLGQGRYRPYRRLPLPEQHSIGDVRVSTAPIHGFSLNGEVALSDRDVNTFSSINDKDNGGAAGTAGITFARENWNLLGWRPQRVEANLKVRRRDDQFEEINRATEVEFEREWDVARSARTEETIREASARVNPLKSLGLFGSYGDLIRPSQKSFRKNVGGTLAFGQRFRASGSHLDLESTDRALNRKGNWIRQRFESSGTISRFSPRASIERERKRNVFSTGVDGFRFLDYRTGLATVLPWNLGWDGEYLRRLDDLLTSADSYQAHARAYTASSEVQWRPPDIGSTLVRYAHREKEYLTADSSDVVNDVGRLETLIVPRSRLFETNLIYEVAKTQSQNQILIAIEVPAGTGNYRREGDQYIPDDQGNYILVPRNTGDYAPATELTMNGLIWLRPDELSDSDLSPILRALSTETEVQVEERTRLPLSGRLLMLDQTQFRGDSTLTGTLALRQDMHIRRLSQKLALRLRYRTTASLQNQYLNGGQERTLREGSVRVRAKYWTSLRGETESTLSRERLRYVSGTFADRDIDRFELSQDNTLTLNRSWDLGVGISAAEVNDEQTRTQVSLRELRPHATYNLYAKGRLDLEATWIHASSNKSQIPFELGRGSNRGENLRWSVRGTYQFGQNFSGSLNYTGRADADEQTVHTGRLEVRATL